ncbi:unnamed protein product [Rhizoctonia solani]|uniref:Signal peptidase complex catalytic subunit SEC11 n=1 Tax=Rhizoctonia solani TaxID=456999 RepID=A0A8H3AHN8_9AGAM|nr:unnamed protein product [Rhizoctonia solani]
MFEDEIKTLKRLGVRAVLLQIMNFAMVISTGLMVWKGMGLVTNTESPIVVVLRNVTVPTEQLLLTKGDNNALDDIELYRGLRWLERKHIVGKVQGFLPYVGYATIAMNDFPQLKYALLGGLGLMALVQRE